MSQRRTRARGMKIDKELRELRREAVRYYDTWKRICIVCETETEEGIVYLLRLFGNIYVHPEKPEAYLCKCRHGQCECKYSPMYTRMYMQWMTEGIRLI